MGSLHGKDSVVYLGAGTGVAAVQISEAAEWSIDLDYDLATDPALGDSWETALKGLSRWSGSISGNLDDAQDTLWDATVASTKSALYIYTTSGTPTKYYYGFVWPKVSVDGGVSGKENASVSFTGEGELAKNPA